MRIITGAMSAVLMRLYLLDDDWDYNLDNLDDNYDDDVCNDRYVRYILRDGGRDCDLNARGGNGFDRLRFLAFG